MPSEDVDITIETDLSRLPTEVLTVTDQPARLELLKADDRLESQVVSNGTIAMLGFITEGGAPAELALKVDTNFVTVSFQPGMQHQHLTEALRAALPLGYELARLPGSSPEVLILKVMRQRSLKPTPSISFLANDPAQRFTWVGDNRMQISGTCGAGEERSVLQLVIDGNRIGLWLHRGDAPLTTAMRLRDALPANYRALIELPISESADVTVTILGRR